MLDPADLSDVNNNILMLGLVSDAFLGSVPGTALAWLNGSHQLEAGMGPQKSCELAQSLGSIAPKTTCMDTHPPDWAKSSL